MFPRCSPSEPTRRIPVHRATLDFGIGCTQIASAKASAVQSKAGAHSHRVVPSTYETGARRPVGQANGK
jgi:hypothetical protein